MREIKIKIFLSMFFIISHLGIILYLSYYHFYEGWIDEIDYEAASFILAPIFFTITTIIVKSSINNKNRKLNNKKKANILFVFISFFFPLTFILLTILLIYNQATGRPLENFVSLLGILESFFAVYIGYIISSIYKIED